MDKPFCAIDGNKDIRCAFFKARQVFEINMDEAARRVLKRAVSGRGADSDGWRCGKACD
jgi:hypothetical protein